MQTLDEALMQARKLTGSSTRILHDVDFSDCDDSLLGIIVKSNCEDHYNHRDNVDGNHNVYIHVVHKGEQLPYLSAIMRVVNEEAFVPQRCSGDNVCAQQDGSDVYIPVIHCGFEARELDVAVKKKVKEVIDDLSNHHLIKSTTAAKAYAAFQLDLELQPKRTNGEKEDHARY